MTVSRGVRSPATVPSARQQAISAAALTRWLAIFTDSGSPAAACQDTGITTHAILVQRQRDPAFARQFAEALEQGMQHLTLQALAQGRHGEQVVESVYIDANGAQTRVVKRDAALKTLVALDRLERVRRADDAAQQAPDAARGEAERVKIDRLAHLLRDRLAGRENDAGHDADGF